MNHRAPLRVERSGRVLTLTLNRPDAGNAFDIDLAQRIRNALLEAETDPRIGAIVIRAEGKLFCAGGDVAAMDAAEDTSAYVKELAVTLSEVMLALSRSAAIVVAEVDGAAAGAGLGLVLNVDLVIASARSSFLSAYSGVGFVPDAGVSRRLPELVGPRRALELTVTDRVLRAAEAVEWGIVNEVCDDAESLRARTTELASHIAEGPGAAHAETKRLLAQRSEPYEDHLAAEVRGLMAMLTTEDARTRLSAFVNRRRK